MSENERTSEVYSKVDLLIKGLKDRSPFVRENTAFELRHLRNPKVVDALIEASNDENPRVRAAVFSSLEALCGIAPEKTITVFLKALADPEISVCQSAVKGLAFLKRQESIGPLIRALENPNPQIRLYAAMALGRIGNERATGPVLKALRDEKDKKVRATLLIALGMLGNPVVLPVLVKLGLTDPDRRVRANTIEALGRLKGVEPQVLINYIRPLLKEDDNRVKANACMTLWKLGDLSVMDEIALMLHSNNKWDRASAAYVLGDIKSPEGIPLLEKLMKDPELDVRLNVVRALKKIGTARTVPLLLTLLDDEEELIAGEAYDAIISIQDRSAVWRFIKLLSDQEKALRFVGAKALMNIANHEVLEQVLTRLVKEKDEDIRNVLVPLVKKIVKNEPLECARVVFSRESTMIKEQQSAVLDALEGEKSENVTRALELAAQSRINEIAARARGMLEKLKSSQTGES